jgi:kynurenine formamidase
VHSGTPRLVGFDTWGCEETAVTVDVTPAVGHSSVVIEISLMQIIDLSAPIVPSRPDALPVERVEIHHTNHAQGAAQVQELFGVPPELLRNGEGWAIEEFTKLGTHSVTHVDAPWHYNSKIQGMRSASIDELPLEWFFADGVVVNMTHKDDGERVEAAEIEGALASVGYQLKPRDIVLVRTGRDAFYGQPDYVFRGSAVTAAATRWLYDQGVRVMGIDAWGWDGPLDRQAREALARQEPGVFWAAHQADLAYSQIERLVNLAALPPYGFKVACFPLKIQGGSAGPARVVAILAA